MQRKSNYPCVASSGEKVCNGTLKGSRHVLTAEECLVDNATSEGRQFNVLSFWPVLHGDNDFVLPTLFHAPLCSHSLPTKQIPLVHDNQNYNSALLTLRTPAPNTSADLAWQQQWTVCCLSHSWASM